ncbi:MAG TPA: S8 family peptidase [Clostridiales bacterium]|nr:S8 family peptidase [Clostridiales bacterium]
MMLPVERNRIISEDYADLIIEYNGNTSVFEQFPDSTVQIINIQLAFVHVPVSFITQDIVYRMGYSVLPTCFGIISESSLEASGVFQLRNIPIFNLRGQGILIGIIDTGVDYTNPIFQYADNTTRIVSIWDQTIVSDNPPTGMEYGTEYTREQINEALQNDNPLSVVPSTDDIGHGTMLAGISGGNEVAESGFMGVASDAEFAVVKLKPAKQFLKDFFYIPDNAVCFQETDIFLGVQYLYDLSIRLGRPMVICIALGSSQGAHDGLGTLSTYISNISTTPQIGVVVAAGNEGNNRRHYSGRINPTIGYDTVELNVGENEPGFSMELWGSAPDIYSIDILSPSGEYIPRIVAGRNEHRVISFIFEATIIYVDYQMVESQSGEQLILIRFDNPSQGIWRFNVYERGGLNLGFNIWLPMEGFISENTYFIRSDPYTTLLTLGNAVFPLTVTAYNDADDSLYLDSSRGFTRINRIKPEIAAPGVNVTGPTLDGSFAPYTGTSVSAAHVTGIAALIYEWGIVRGNLPLMSTVELKNLIIRGAKRDINLIYPNRDWGYGILDVFNVFDALRGGIGI